MYLFWTLLLKDLRRIARNPLPLVILLAIPLVISTLIGSAFGGGGGGESQISPIRLGVIDEDDSIFSRFMRGAAGQSDFSDRIQLTFLENREESVELIQDGELSAVLIIPKGFSESLVHGEDGLKLELIKNPAEYIYPTLAQEGAEVVVTALNVLVRNFEKDLRELHGLLEEEREFDFFRDMVAITTLLERTKNRLDTAAIYINPPLVTYGREEDSDASSELSAETDPTIGDLEAEKETKEEVEFNLFAYLLIGMVGMFLLMIADNCMRDLYKETRNRTLERFRTMRERLWQFIAVKVSYTVIVLLLSFVILIGIGSLAFGFGWSHYLPTLALAISYSIFGAGFMGLIAAIAGKERRADMLNTMIVIFMSAVGGAMWPTQNLPPFVQKYLTPVSPVYWFSDELRVLQMNPEQSEWLATCGLLVGVGILTIGASSSIFRFRLERGIKE